MDNIRIIHNDTREYIYPKSRNSIIVKVVCSLQEKAVVNIVYWNKFAHNDERKVQLRNFNINGCSDYFSTELEFNESVKYLNYYFEILSLKKAYFYSPHGLTIEIPTKTFEYQCTNENDIFQTPDWAEGIVGYQIFPERFFKGYSNINVTEFEEWNTKPSRTNFFGGNIKGIIDKFNYLKDLGIKMIYLTPIFLSHSNHKYDTIDYFKIDPHFGSINDLKELVNLSHENDIRVIIDGVFNHIGYYSNQFQDVIKNGKKSKFWDWFYIYGDAVDVETTNYECVGYYKWMPKLRYSSTSLRKFILSVGEYWINESGIDGWRLDVADEVDFTFWQEFRRKIKTINKETLLIGETWKDGRDLLRGDQMDTIMNYRVRDTLIDYFANNQIDTYTFRERIEYILFNYPIQSHNVLYNLLGSHDTERITTVCNNNWDKEKLLIVFQMTFPGMPVVYYGDEIGIEGESDPDCRQTMKWDCANEEILSFYKGMIRVRNNNEALKYGDFHHIHFSEEIYGFIREFNNESIIVIFNNSKERYQADLNRALDLENKVVVDIEPQQSKIIKITRKGEKMKVTNIELN